MPKTEMKDAPREASEGSRRGFGRRKVCRFCTEKNLTVFKSYGGVGSIAGMNEYYRINAFGICRSKHNGNSPLKIGSGNIIAYGYKHHAFAYNGAVNFELGSGA